MPPKKGGKKKKESEPQEPEHDASWERVILIQSDLIASTLLDSFVCLNYDYSRVMQHMHIAQRGCM